MRVDKEVVRQRLERMLFELDEIECKLPATAETYAAPETESLRYELEHRMFIALQALLDVSSHCAICAGARELMTYKDAVIAMGRLGIVESALAERLEGAPGLRNAIAHEYLDVDAHQVYAGMLRSPDMRAFGAAVWEWTERQR